MIMRWLAHRGGALDFRDHAWQSGAAVSHRGGARRRPGDDPRRSDAGAGHAKRIPVRRVAARRAHRDRQVPRAQVAGSRERRNRARRLHPTATRRARWKAPSATTPATTTKGALSGLHGRAHHDAPRSIYHTTYTGKPPDEPAILGVALNEVFVPLLQKQFPEIVGFLPAAGRLLLPPGGGQHEKAVSRGTPSA